MDVLITGGAGFLGHHLCEYYVHREDRVLCYDNLITGSRSNLDDLEAEPNFKFINHDVTEYIDLEQFGGEFSDFDPDGVIHFASLASPDDYVEYPIKTLKVGALGTHRTLGVAKRYDARFLLASTSEVYGDPEVHPQPEDYWGHVNPIGPRGVYDESKRLGESFCMAYNRSHDVKTRIARIFNTYGPGMRASDGRVVPNFICQALRGDPLTVYGAGSQTRSFCYVSDLIKGVVRLLESDCEQPVNIGNPDEMTIMEFARVVQEVTGTDSEIVHKPLPEDDPEVRQPDISRAREQLDWAPDVPLEAGLEKTISYFRGVLEENSGVQVKF